MWIWWAVIACVFLIIELISVSFWAIFFGIAALITGFLSRYIDSLLLQVIIFVFISLILIPLLRPVLQRLFKVNVNVKHSTTDALIGKTGIVIKGITGIQNGMVKLEGDTWTAKSEDLVDIEEGSQVIVKEVEGVKLIVHKKEN